MKVMIIEDDRIQSTSLKFQLIQLGVNDITIVDNGVAAHQKLDKERYDIIFCDIRMPQMDGVTLLSDHIDKTRTSGIVIMSAVDDSILNVTRGVCRLIGYDFIEILSKPFEMGELKALLERFNENEQLSNREPITVGQVDVLNAFSEDRIFVLYQPQFDFRSGKLHGVEALVRLDHPDLGVLAPISFLHLIDELGMDMTLYETVLKKATNAMIAAGCRAQLSINISQSMLEEDLCNRTLQICNEVGFPTNQLTLELTEEQAYRVSVKALANLARLRLHDVELSIDDFGTGFASLDKLVDLPFTELKIDRKFVIDLHKDYKRQQITNLSLQLAHSLGLNCVAEGVEDIDTWDYLRESGVDICQGYFTGKPMSLQNLLATSTPLNDIECNCEDQLGNIVGVILDKHKESSLAISKLLSKQLCQSHFLTPRTTAETEKVMRDVPVNLLVIDEELYQNAMSLGLSFQHDFVRTIVLTDELTIDKNQQDLGENIYFLERKNVVVETVNQVIERLIKLKETEDNNSQHFKTLSKRENAVVQMLMSGHTNKYISYELDISQKTVSTYKTRILQKLGVKSTVELFKLLQQE